MSLYYEAAALLANADAKGGSLKSRIFGKKDLKSSPGAVFALITEATKWSAPLKDIIERSEILKLEKRVRVEERLIHVMQQLVMTFRPNMSVADTHARTSLSPRSPAI